MGGLNVERLFGHLFMVGIVGTIVFGIAAWLISLSYMVEAGWDTGIMSLSLLTFLVSAWVIGLVAPFQGYWWPFITIYLLLTPCLLMTYAFMDYEQA